MPKKPHPCQSPLKRLYSPEIRGVAQPGQRTAFGTRGPAVQIRPPRLMFGRLKRIDGVVEAIRYAEDGNLEEARLYLRRGGIWSDRLIYDRNNLLQLLQDGKKLYTGSRKKYQGSSFTLQHPVKLLNSKDRKNIILAGVRLANHDQIKDLPVF